MIVIVPPDNRVGINGVWRSVSIDMPHINAARLDGPNGSIEFRLHNGEWPAPEALTEVEFRAKFRGVLEAWETAPDASIQRAASDPPQQQDDARVKILEAQLRSQADMIKGLQAQVAFVIANSDAPDPNAG